MIEVEIKYPLKNPEVLRRRLGEGQVSCQTDVYYTPAHRDFTSADPITEWLRVRITDQGASMTYKDWKKAGGTSCEELETEISDPDALMDMFARLDLRKVAVVKKTRTTWKHDDTEIALDDVEGLGSFVELESKGDFTDAEAATKHLQQVLADLALDVGEQEFRGYPYRMLEKGDAQ